MIALANIGLWIDGVNTHNSHHSADLLTVNYDFIIAPDYLRECSIAPGGVSSVYFVDSAHDEQVLVRNSLLFRGIAIYAAAINAQQISLSADGQAGIAEINAFLSSNQVRGFV